MTETTQFLIGAEASTADGACGEVSRVIVDPIARAVTHVVVEPTRGRGLARLVPIDLIGGTPDALRLDCSTAEFDRLEPAVETYHLPVSNSYAGYGPGQLLAWPYYALGMGGGIGGGLGIMSLGDGDVPQTVTYDSIPVGEVDVRRGERVQATDGEIGLVQGLVIDPRAQHVTHVLLQEGHLWGRKQVAIPIGSVTRVDDGIRLSISKHEVEELPEVHIDQHEI